MCKGRKEKETPKHSAKTFSRAGIHGNKWNHFKLEGGYLWETAHRARFRDHCVFVSLKMELPVEFLGQPDTEKILKSNEMRGCRENKGLRTPHTNKLGGYTPNLVYYNHDIEQG